MSKRNFLVLFIVFYLLLKITPLLNNNFFFTMDQARDAVFLRDIAHHHFYWYGPSTAINGFYSGALWFYFLLPGHLFFNGHPFGAVSMLLLLNLGLSLVLYRFMARLLTPPKALLIIFSLQFFWDFYDTTRYAFNPFPTLFLTFFLIILLVNFFKQNEKYFLPAAVFVGLCFHSQIAYALPLAIFYFVLGIYAILTKKLQFSNFFKAVFVFLSFFIFHFVYEMQNNFAQITSLIRYLGENNNVNTDYFLIIKNLLITIPGSIIFPQIPLMGFLIYLGLLLYFLFRIKANHEIKIFVGLSNLLWVFVFVFFLIGPKWESWHTVALSSLIFVSVLLIIFSLPQKIGLLFFSLLMIQQLGVFIPRYRQYFSASGDPSLLANEIKVIDWVYQKAEDQGFSVYNYLPSVLDYPYQYLFWWHGLKKYGYLPCEYSSFPGSPGIFIPNKKAFIEPKKCGNLRFLIIEPNLKHPELRTDWIKELEQGYQLVEETTSGQILMQKYLPNN